MDSTPQRVQQELDNECNECSFCRRVKRVCGKYPPEINRILNYFPPRSGVSSDLGNLRLASNEGAGKKGACQICQASCPSNEVSAEQMRHEEQAKRPHESEHKRTGWKLVVGHFPHPFYRDQQIAQCHKVAANDNEPPDPFTEE